MEERQELSLGWRFKISRRLRRSDWKERQEVPSGWNFKGRRLLRLEWSVGQRRQRGQRGQVARITGVVARGPDELEWPDELECPGD